MRKHFLIIFTVFGILLPMTANAQLFQQQFNSALPYFSNGSCADANYVATTNPTSSQFTYIASNNASMLISVPTTGDSAYSLRLFRNNGGTAIIARNVSFNGPPGAVKIKFDYKLWSTSGNSSKAPFHFWIGSSVANSNTLDTTNYHSKFTINFRSVSSLPKFFVWPTETTSSYPSAPTLYDGVQTITFVVNHTGVTLSYTSPTGGTETVANDCWDLWVGNNKEIDERPAKLTTQTLSQFKMMYGFTTTSTLTIDNMSIEELTAGQAPSTQVSGINFSSVTPSSMRIAWTNGNGDGRAVFVREADQGTITNPANGTSYTASSDWSSKGSQLSNSGYYCVYNGTGNYVDMSNLAGGTTYWVQAFEYNGSGLTSLYQTAVATSNPNSQATSSITVPTVTTTAISSITASTASSGGEVTASGGASVTARGVCWSTSVNPTISNSLTSDGTGIGIFTSSITGLSPGTTYHVRAYATNSAGTGYGDDLSFTTTSVTLPTVTTAAITSITTNSASGGGNVTLDGGASITARGVCWNTTGNPTISNSHTSDGTGTGSFTSSLTGLSFATTYYVRAYATNSQGTNYGEQVTFSTLAIFYNVENSDLINMSSWGTNTDGSGSHPATFNINYATFNISNPGSYISEDFSVSGTATKIVLGNGTSPVSFTAPSGIVFSGTVDLSNNSTFIIQNSSFNSFGNISAGSIVNFDGSESFTIPALNFGSISSTNDEGASRTFASSGIIGIAGSFLPGSAAYTVNGSAVEFNGTTAQTVPGCKFNKVIINNTAGCSTSGKLRIYDSLKINENFTLTAGDTLFAMLDPTVSSTGCKVVVAASKQFTVNGIFNNTAVAIDHVVNGTMTVGSSGKYLVNATNVNIPQNVAFQAGSVLYVLASPGSSRLHSTNLLGDVVWNVPGSGGTTTIINSSTNSCTLGGSFTMINGIINLGTGGSTRTLRVGGNLNINGGVFQLVGSGSSGTGNCVCEVTGDVNVNGGSLILTGHIPAAGGAGNLNVSGNLNISSGMITDSTGATRGVIQLKGTSAQSVAMTGGSLGQINVNVNNSAGAFLAGNVVLPGGIIMTVGKLTLGSYDLTLGNSSTISGASSTNYIIATGTGRLKKQFSSTGSFTFPVGDNDGTPEYSPLTVNFTSGTFNSAEVSLGVTNSKHASNTSTANYLNRYWSLSSSGITDFKTDISANYLSADVSGNESNLYGGRWSGTEWFPLPLVNSNTHTLSASGISNFSDFSAGEDEVMVGNGCIINLTAIPQGYYSAGSSALTADYPLTASLYSVSSLDTPVEQWSLTLNKTTFGGKALFSANALGEYYLVVKGTNALETWSKDPLMLSSGKVNYDFTTDAAQAYGNNMTRIGSKWCLYSGDINQDGKIDYTDLRTIDAQVANYASGSLVTDLNGDGIIDFSDIKLCDNNSYANVQVSKPSTVKPAAPALPGGNLKTD